MTIPTARAVAATSPMSPHDVGAAATGKFGSERSVPGSDSVPDRGGSDGAMSVIAEGRVGASSNQRSASAEAGEGGSGGGVFSGGSIRGTGTVAESSTGGRLGSSATARPG
jgi:hypothetical protein